MTAVYKLFALGLLFAVAGCAAYAPAPAPASVPQAGIGEVRVLAADTTGAAEAPAPASTPAHSGNTRMTQASRSGEALGAFETTFKAKQTNRSHNIARASDSINNQIIQPGETFSYNEAVGPTSKRRGYKKGMIFIRGEKHEGYGGGVCQVSSTLYNAAANAGMTIVERHDHSRPVDYVETGNDAATSYGGVDLKFKNEKPFPVIIKSQVQEGRVSVSINAV